MSDCLFGIKGRDFVMMAADGHCDFSVINFKTTEDKLYVMDQNKLFGASGSQGERSMFCEFIQKNIHLYRLRHSVSLSTKAAANFTRRELADALRRGPYQVNLLVGGLSPSGSPELFYIDYLASMQEMNRAAHGYGAYFTLGLLDRFWKPDMTEEEGVMLMQKCIQEVKTRFMLKKTDFFIKIVDKNGVRVIQDPSKDM